MAGTAIASSPPRLAAPHPRQHVPALDGLRAVAVVAVMFCHADLLDSGGFGVHIFFVLSGYLITGILLDERERYHRVNFLNFYARRWLRLAPALWLLVALFLITAKLIHLPHLNGQVQDSGMALLYISNWTRVAWNRPDYLGHTWSLSVEEQFYLFWPPLVIALHALFRRRWPAALACLLAVIAIAAWRFYLEAHGASFPRISNALDTCSDPLLLGAALAFFLPRLPRLAATLITLAGALLLAALFSGHASADPLTAAIAALLLMLGILNHQASPLARLLALKPIVWIGRISYGLYLFHFPLMIYLHDVRHWYPRDIALFAFPATFLLATISYYGIERPALRLKDRFRPAPERGRPGALAVEPIPLSETLHAPGNQVHARQP